ncbi:MAG: hypothetical protein JO056_09565 [Alphaproteobacteria bacterium]|nr:hypothetical protein [Alphaproteobacteria bacterium]
MAIHRETHTAIFRHERSGSRIVKGERRSGFGPGARQFSKANLRLGGAASKLEGHLRFNELLAIHAPLLEWEAEA